MYREIANYCLPAAATIREAIACIDRNGQGIALVVDDQGTLLGTVTDGDIRRGLLRGLSLAEPVRSVMNAAPITAPVGTGREELLALMRKRSIRQVPLVDARGRVVALEVLSRLLEDEPERSTPVLILAGGQGRRLRPLTEKVPKPLLPIGGKPLLQVIVEQLRSYGFRHLLVSVNYLAEKIQAFLGDGRWLGVEVEYVPEDRPLGTAGPIRLAREKLREPFLVVNGDLVTRVHFAHFLHYHVDGGYDLTLGVKQFDYQIPFGVVRMEGDRVVGLQEKPIHTYFVSAGFYALRPEVIDLIPPDTGFDMPELIERLLREGWKVGGFPVHEYWADIGRYADYERAQVEYAYHFGGDR